MTYQNIFFDFDGVLSTDRFYTNLNDQYPEVYEFIQNNIFAKWNNRCNRWMRNEVSMYDINKHISDNTTISYDTLKNLFEQSIKDMQLDLNLIEVAKQLKTKGKKIWIITNNMDVFTQITIPYNWLDQIFDFIINSSDHWLLKQDENWKLFDIALDKLWISDYSSCLLIDDSATARDMFEKKWWTTYAYSEFGEFSKWASENLY